MVPIADNMNMTPEPPTQNCSNCSQAFVPELNVIKAVALGLILGTFIIFGVFGNILVILSVVCHRHLRTVTHYFIVNLAVADLLLSSIVLPFSATFEILGYWVFGRPFCNVWAAVDVLCCTASIMSLCVISVDRYIGVSYPLRYPAIVTERRALLALVGLWALSVTISIGPLFGWKEPAPEDESICKITEEPAYAIFSAVGSFYLPLAIILSMYCRVYVVARQESRGLREGHKTDKSDSESITLRIHRGNTAVSEDEALRSHTHFALRLLKFSREKKAAKTLGIVVGCFVLCWLPFFLVLPIGSIFPAYRPSDTVFKITFWLGYFNSCINPIIYPCSNQEFKKAFQSILGVRCLRAQPRATHHLGPGLSQAQVQGHSLTLRVDGRGDPSRLSPSSSIALSRTPSSRDDREWKIETGQAKVAQLCSRSLLKTCCCIRDGSLNQGPSHPQPLPHGALPTIKIHQLSFCENGEAV
ncbi:alpha-1A adrenergic receptor-like [Oncorhynchus tshawytscha]|uniref:Alpha-1A adrenergic receptor n=1 Tax=Oncorhynchus tshawytscha TaxID=74940 RepID=A0A8C8K0T8_ONCTS|nr:alpha-1A adrenergic receptor-like [Oncorhynchus tshawytscha]